MACYLAVTIAKGKVSGEQLIKILSPELVSGLLKAYAEKQGYRPTVTVVGDDIICYWPGVQITVNRVRHIAVETYNRTTADRIRTDLTAVLSLGAQQAIATLIQNAVAGLGEAERLDISVDNEGTPQMATRLRIAF